jgi:hypothetical protein
MASSEATSPDPVTRLRESGVGGRVALAPPKDGLRVADMRDEDGNWL